MSNLETIMQEQSTKMAIYSAYQELLKWIEHEKLDWDTSYKSQSKKTYTVESGLSIRDEGRGCVIAFNYVESEIRKRIEEINKKGLNDVKESDDYLKQRRES